MIATVATRTMRFVWVGMAVLVVAAAMAAGALAQSYPYPHCDPGQEPSFVRGIETLATLLGDTVGQPVECAHPNPQNGDLLQLTTRGLAYWREHASTPTFTNGWDHWALREGGLIHWSGESVDPPPSAGADNLPPRAPQLYGGVVLHVLTGDTLVVQVEGGDAETLRLIGVSANDSAACYGSEAVTRAKGLLPRGTPVSLELDAAQHQRDQYGHLPAYLWLPDGANFGEQMLRGGYARVSASTGPYRYLTQFLAAQEHAQASGLGQWGACNGTTSRVEPSMPAILSNPGEVVAAIEAEAERLPDRVSELSGTASRFVGVDQVSSFAVLLTLVPVVGTVALALAIRRARRNPYR